MTLKLALLVAALVVAVVGFLVDFSVIDVEGNQHLAGLVFLCLGCYFGSLLARN